MITSATAILSPWDTTGTSGEAQFIANESYQITRRLHESIALGLEGKGVFGELFAVYTECSDPNWDGYSALPVLPETYDNTRRYLESLPLGTPPPSVGAEPDGHLTLEWHSAPRKTLSVSIAPDGNLHYASIIGPFKRFGTEPIASHGSEIINLIRRVLTN